MQASVAEKQVKAPAEMFAIMDSRGSATGLPPGFTWGGVDFTFCKQAEIDSLNSALAHPPQHGKNFNVVFCDGHVAQVQVVNLFNPTNTARFWNNDNDTHQESW